MVNSSSMDFKTDFPSLNEPISRSEFEEAVYVVENYVKLPVLTIFPQKSLRTILVLISCIELSPFVLKTAFHRPSGRKE